ncbi:anti-sigma factor family protein [Mucilaginibacter myungsuensis]|uniref:Uncharacterized protein n=1 Tax=Mucilaginibacter myungsuensis TaxID=649104 RepID=A0A929KVQ9_9SPHI|nr:hypothetical protein [Mucilaginibacter myungsuensis]MBE9661607.1 hypothetical protein [Mucilaginibacter myungsuensis]MDN3597752.1 hypothetical protein [Mucilaginibacter myungsuensis]
MNDTEEKLWNYIDGTCTPADRAQIEERLITDVAFKQQYEELVLINAEFTTLELDEPPMAFSYNVMEQIRKQEALAPLKAKVDKRIVYAVAGFFLLAISALLLLTLSNLGWSDNASPSVQTGIKLPVKLTIPDMGNLFNGVWMRYFLFFDMVLLLFLADAYLRRKPKTTAFEK